MSCQGFFFSSRAEPHSAGVLHGQTQRAILHHHEHQRSLKVYLSVERKKTNKKKKGSASAFQFAASRRKLVRSPRGYFYLQLPAGTEFNESLHAALAVP